MNTVALLEAHEVRIPAIPGITAVCESFIRWQSSIVERIRRENAAIVSFNWDPVVDQMLFEKDLGPECYGLSKELSSVLLGNGDNAFQVPGLLYTYLLAG